MLRPDCPIGVVVAVRVLAVDDAHRVRLSELEQTFDCGDSHLRVWHEQAPALLREVVLHVERDEPGSRRTEADLVLDGVPRNRNRVAHAAIPAKALGSLAARRPTRRTKLA
jgi:hypothetical protein